MERFIVKDLKAWKASAHRKPLILRGARQVGKTYIVKKFGLDSYQNLAYFNFDHDKNLASLFEATKDPTRIIEQLSLATGQKISPAKTLIFFDEIQECPDALNSLKYFHEETPEYHVIAAGSLLGVRLSNTSFPVGKVNFLDLHPMSFSEFLVADGYGHLVDFVETLTNHTEITEIPDIFVSQLAEKLKTYFIVGGMPEATLAWVKEKDIALVRQIQNEIINSYESDFSKHVTASEANKISLIWKGIISQLTKDNKKFIYQAIKTGARAREYESALNWLRDAGLIEKIPCVTKPNLPLEAYEDLSAFKIYLLDTGLLCAMSHLDSSIVIEGDRLFSEFKGALTENYVIQCLRATGIKYIPYFTFDRYEIDVLASISGEIIPIEIKSGANSPHKSLTNYIKKYSPELAVRLSPNNLKRDGQILNLPLYLTEKIEKLAKISLQESNSDND